MNRQKAAKRMLGVCLGPQLMSAIHNRLAAQLRGNHGGQQGRQVVGLVHVRAGAQRGNDGLRHEFDVRRHVLHGGHDAVGGGLAEEGVKQAARADVETGDPEPGHQHLGPCGCGVRRQADDFHVEAVCRERDAEVDHGGKGGRRIPIRQHTYPSRGRGRRRCRHSRSSSQGCHGVASATEVTSQHEPRGPGPSA